MIELILTFIILLSSIIILWKGSDWMTDSLIPVAQKLGTGYIAITTVLISLLLIIPELFVAIYSYLFGHLNVGLGVIIGSVMINIGLSVGLIAAIKPLKVDKQVAIRDGIFLIAGAVVVLLFGSDLKYTRTEGAVLLVLLIPYALNVWYSEQLRSMKSRKAKVKSIEKNLYLMGKIKIFDFNPSIKIFFLGGFFLALGSYFFSYSLINLSEMLPLPEIVIGIVFGAIGTELPNLFAAVQGTLKGYKDVAITETLGSNIFTLLLIIGTIAVLNPFNIAGKIFYYDLTWMIIINLLMIGFIFKGYRYKEASITRFEGISLVLFYIAILVADIFLF